jgi:molybdate transport system ATP-binding protein
MNAATDNDSIFVDFQYTRGGQSFGAKFSCGNGIGVISGPSGCGKTTILKCIAGLIDPAPGVIRLAKRVLFDSEKRVNLSAQQRAIGYVPQNAALFPHMTVRQNILYSMHSSSSNGSDSRVQEIAVLLGISDLLENRPQRLSGGQAQRVALARAIAYEPNLYLMDEPLSNLDDEAKTSLMSAIRMVREVSQKPVLYVTHSESEAQQLADWRFKFTSGILQSV